MIMYDRRNQKQDLISLNYKYESTTNLVNLFELLLLSFFGFTESINAWF